MKRNTMQRLALLILAAVVAFGTFTFGTGEAYAASEKWTLSVDNPMYVGSPGGFWVFDENDWEKEATIISAKSSAPKICSVNKDKYDGKTYYSLEAKKAGKAKITVTFKTPKGKKYTKSKTIKVKSYPNMIKSLSVNGKAVSVSKSKNSYMYNKEGTKATSVKIKIVPAKGWKIENTYGYVYKRKGVPKKITKKMVTGKSAISFSKSYNELDVHVMLMKESDGSYVDYNIDLMR